MLVIKGKTISQAYKKLLKKLMKAPVVGSTREINNCCVIVENPDVNDIFFPYRDVSQEYSKAELEWYWSGDNSCKTIGQHAKMWLKLSDDGETNNSAYGYILEKKYGFDQIQQIIDCFNKDINTRRAVLNISDPAINRVTTKDMQCTIAIQFLVRDGNLEETVYMRSNDVYFGFPYDYIYFISIGQYIAEKLNVSLVKYTHHATSLHMYLKDIDKFKKHDNKFDVDIMKIVDERYNDEK